MKLFSHLSQYLSGITTIDATSISLLLSSITVVILFILIKRLGKSIIKKTFTGRKEFVINQTYQIIINTLEVVVFLFIWDEYIQSLMTLISVISAAMTIALREIILNFFCGIYIKLKKPFKVEDRIQIGDIKGDVMSISSLNFELLEISNKEENGQSTGIVITYPNSVALSSPIKNINKGFKYIWDEMIIRIDIEGDLTKNKQEIYKIINNIEIIKNIPKKMKEQISDINTTNRIYFNKYDPMIYTKIVNGHIELSLRFLIHPKKARYVESIIWNKIYLAYQKGEINLYTKEV